MNKIRTPFSVSYIPQSQAPNIRGILGSSVRSRIGSLIQSYVTAPLPSGDLLYLMAFLLAE